jgi:hypothetical protein
MKVIDDVPPLPAQEAARRRELLKRMERYFEYSNSEAGTDVPKYAPYASQAAR